MLEKWKNRITACSGIELNIASDGSINISLVRISLKNKLIHIDDKKVYQGVWDEVLNIPNEPVALSITGKGVLIKKTSRMEMVTEQNLQHLFPNMNLSEFYVQHFQSGAFSFLSIVRVEVVDEILEEFKKQGVEVLMFSLGPFVVDQVLNQLNVYGSQVDFHGHQITLDSERNWVDYKYSLDISSRFALKIDIETMPEEYVVAYATAFQLILHDKMNLVEVENQVFKQRLEEFMAGMRFKRNAMMVLMLFFSLLFINVLVYSYYHNLNESLSNTVGQQSDFSVHKEKLIADVNKKEQMIKDLGWNKGLSYAFLCDQIGRTTPSAVLLTELSINSPNGKGAIAVKEDRLGSHHIRLKGQAENVYVINDWIHDLKKTKWVKGVQLEKYKTDDQIQKQVFTILLNY